MLITNDFDCRKVLVESTSDDFSTRKLFKNKRVAIGFNIIKKPDYDNLNSQKEGCLKKFGEDCVEWFKDGLLKSETYMKI